MAGSLSVLLSLTVDKRHYGRGIKPSQGGGGVQLISIVVSDVPKLYSVFADRRWRIAIGVLTDLGNL